jgi:hypothetical protein
MLPCQTRICKVRQHLDLCVLCDKHATCMLLLPLLLLLGSSMLQN